MPDMVNPSPYTFYLQAKYHFSRKFVIFAALWRLINNPYA